MAGTQKEKVVEAVELNKGLGISKVGKLYSLDSISYSTDGTKVFKVESIYSSDNHEDVFNRFKIVSVKEL